MSSEYDSGIANESQKKFAAVYFYDCDSSNIFFLSTDSIQNYDNSVTTFPYDAMVSKANNDKGKPMYEAASVLGVSHSRKDLEERKKRWVKPNKRNSVVFAQLAQAAEKKQKVDKKTVNGENKKVGNEGKKKPKYVKQKQVAPVLKISKVQKNVGEKLKHLTKLNFGDSANQDLEQQLKEREQLLKDLQRKIDELGKQQNLLRNAVRPPSTTGSTSSPRRTDSQTVDGRSPSATGSQTVDGRSPSATAPSPSLARTRSQTSASRSPSAATSSPSLARTRSQTVDGRSPSAAALFPSLVRTRSQTLGNRSPEGQLSPPNATTPPSSTEEQLKSPPAQNTRRSKASRGLSFRSSNSGNSAAQTDSASDEGVKPISPSGSSSNMKTKRVKLTPSRKRLRQRTEEVKAKRHCREKHNKVARRKNKYERKTPEVLYDTDDYLESTLEPKRKPFTEWDDEQEDENGKKIKVKMYHINYHVSVPETVWKKALKANSSTKFLRLLAVPHIWSEAVFYKKAVQVGKTVNREEREPFESRIFEATKRGYAMFLRDTSIIKAKPKTTKEFKKAKKRINEFGRELGLVVFEHRTRMDQLKMEEENRKKRGEAHGEV